MCLAELPEPDTAPALTQEFCSNSHVSYWPVGALPDGGLADATRNGAPRFTAIAMPIASNQLALLNFFASGNAAETLHIWLQNLLKVAPNLAAKVRALPSAPTLLAYRYCEVGVNRCFQQRIVLPGRCRARDEPSVGLRRWLSFARCMALDTAALDTAHNTAADGAGIAAVRTLSARTSAADSTHQSRYHTCVSIRAPDVCRTA